MDEARMESGSTRTDPGASASGAEPAQRQLRELKRLLLERTRLRTELHDVEAALAYHLGVLEGGVL